ncbi:hypothetical protein [Streptococcus intermedius]|uniref:hypothetical protein n=1 Tax=Streptococcus intermedius TaxID=1338 RepID=UPI0003909465|nr:hypothetical protein [Streptococcus intermedius]AGU77492.1 hypothetical protein SII_0287 [Streptococcus intermedius C270]
MVKMDLVSSDDQASSMNMVSANRIAGYQSALTALESFSNASELTGAAYDSAKHYGARVLTPLIQGAILLSEGVSQGTTALPNKYRAEVGEENLDSDVLESQIQAYESSLSSLRGIYRYLERDCSTKPSTLRSMSSRMTSLSNQKTEAMEKLRKLNAFAMSSPTVFSNLPEVSAAMDVGIGQVQTAFANFNGSFQVPSADQLGWAKTIGVEWKKKEELDRAYQRVLDKLKKGEKLTEKDIQTLHAYAKRYPGRELPEEVQKKLKEKRKAAEWNLVQFVYEQFKDAIGSNEAKRLSQLMALLPENFTKAVLKSDGLWEILASVEKTGAKGDKFVTAVLNGLSKYESMGKFGENISKGFKWLEKIANPLKSATKWGLEKVTGFKTLEEAVKTGKNFVGEAKFLGKGIKFLGKVGTVATVAQLGFEGISGGINEFSKSKNTGKAVGKGALSTVSSVGPLEGATIGAAVGGVPGAFIGAGIGAGVQVIKMFEPKFFDDPVKGTKNIIGKVGKGISGAANAVSHAFGGVGKALGFG